MFSCVFNLIAQSEVHVHVYGTWQSLTNDVVDISQITKVE